MAQGLAPGGGRDRSYPRKKDTTNHRHVIQTWYPFRHEQGTGVQPNPPPLLDTPPCPLLSMDDPTRRLIIVVVSPGEDPEIETDPTESFATWEMVAALNRAVEILEQEEFEESLKEGNEDEDS